jgi:hypothetical protein
VRRRPWTTAGGEGRRETFGEAVRLREGEREREAARQHPYPTAVLLRGLFDGGEQRRGGAASAGARQWRRRSERSDARV